MMIARDVYQALVKNREGSWTENDDGSKWYTVYLPNARAELKKVSGNQFAGALSFLADKGCYKPCEWDRQYFGEVKVEA